MQDEVPDGYIAMPAATRRTYALLRSNLSSGSPADVAAALAHGRRVKLYPLSQVDDTAADDLRRRGRRRLRRDHLL